MRALKIVPLAVSSSLAMFPFRGVSGCFTAASAPPPPSRSRSTSGGGGVSLWISPFVNSRSVICIGNVESKVYKVFHYFHYFFNFSRALGTQVKRFPAKSCLLFSFYSSPPLLNNRTDLRWGVYGITIIWVIVQPRLLCVSYHTIKKTVILYRSDLED